MHDTELMVVLLVCVVLALGAFTRMAGSYLRLPYTVAVLLLGVAAGFALRGVGHLGVPRILAETMARGANVSPHLIIFVFLPALVFESAFALRAERNASSGS